MESPLKIDSSNSKLKILENFHQSFLNHFSKFGCMVEEPVKISSGIDPTVRFVGSHISVFKKYLLSVDLPPNGVVIVQDCVRTRNIKRYNDPNFYPNWGSFFTSLGALIPISHIEKVAKHVLDFFFDEIKINPEIFYLRVNSSDKELLNICKKYLNNDRIEIDAKELNYYRHSIGEDNIAGRNFNFALLNKKTNVLEDVGNFIILEKDKIPHSIEIALGTTTIIKIINSFEHILECYPLSLNIGKQSNPNLVTQLQDLIITSSRLLSEGLLPSNKNNRTRILKKYIDTIIIVSNMLNFPDSELLDNVYEYEKLQNTKKALLYEHLKNLTTRND